MGFDILYLPPIHPIGRAFRKGPNNTLTPGPGDPGSPWAIGGPEGGHKDIHPELGTFDDFDRLVHKARDLGILIALDIAFQCSPDHPWVKDHPQWFRHRPDGTIKYAENPPKKYQDIYPIDFESPDWEALWAELLDVFRFWAKRGVTVFRVDNPHTKPFRFWDWCIGELKKDYPEAIFLSEAFTRPKMMKRLAKGGFSQSYTYFTWRNGKRDLTEYVSELVHSDCKEYMRPNFFANTPDILNEYLQVGGRAAFQIRAVLAATLSPTYGIYGPPFEQCVGTPVKIGSEEYLDSEKYQVRHWDLEAPGNLRDYITRINLARREHPALQSADRVWFNDVDNPEIISYTRFTPDLRDIVVVAVNVNPFNAHQGWIKVPLGAMGIDPNIEYEVVDALSDHRYLWRGEYNFVRLDPQANPAHLFVVRYGLSGQSLKH
jgi:starch synthase (maltosyl-transferring)